MAPKGVQKRINKTNRRGARSDAAHERRAAIRGQVDLSVYFPEGEPPRGLLMTVLFGPPHTYRSITDKVKMYDGADKVIWTRLHSGEELVAVAFNNQAGAYLAARELHQPHGHSPIIVERH